MLCSYSFSSFVFINKYPVVENTKNQPTGVLSGICLIQIVLQTCALETHILLYMRYFYMTLTAKYWIEIPGSMFSLKTKQNKDRFKDWKPENTDISHKQLVYLCQTEGFYMLF